LDWPASEPQVKWLEAMETMGVPMTRMMIRVDAEISDELSSAFPHLTPRHQRAHTTLTGDMTDQEELQGVLNLLSSLGISVVEVVTIPDG
jgi:hypothetical protein